VHGSPARWDLSGGPPARAVPTGIIGADLCPQLLVVDDGGRDETAKAAFPAVIQEGNDLLAGELRVHEPCVRHEGTEICEELNVGSSALRPIADAGDLLSDTPSVIQERRRTCRHHSGCTFVRRHHRPLLSMDERREAGCDYAGNSVSPPAVTGASAFAPHYRRCHSLRFFRGKLGWTTPRVRQPEQSDRWTFLVVTAFNELRARGVVADQRLPWEAPGNPARLTPPRVRGFPPATTEHRHPRQTGKTHQGGAGTAGTAEGQLPRHC